MEKYFLPYRLALKLRELGFEQDCLAWFYSDNSGMGKLHLEPSKFGTKYHLNAPLYQQVFEWFNSTYKLSSHADLKSKDHIGDNYYFEIKNVASGSFEKVTVDNFKTIDEANIACVEKLISFCS